MPPKTQAGRFQVGRIWRKAAKLSVFAGSRRPPSGCRAAGQSGTHLWPPVVADSLFISMTRLFTGCRNERNTPEKSQPGAIATDLTRSNTQFTIVNLRLICRYFTQRRGSLSTDRIQLETITNTHGEHTW